MRGKGGGYRLTKSPEQYTLADILKVTEQSLAPVSCLDPWQDSCPRARSCRTLPVWQGLNQVIQDYLDRITLADLIRPDQPGDDYII